METAGQPETPGEVTSSLRQAERMAGPISPPGAEAGRGSLQLRGNKGICSVGTVEGVGMEIRMYKSSVWTWWWVGETPGKWPHGMSRGDCQEQDPWGTSGGK